jgi:CO/xanthine dehydrogenase Mo-binding subunit
MDTSVARAMPGVLDILRYDDPEIKGKKIGSPYSVLFGGVPALRDAAHFYGHQLGAFVVAETEDQAIEAVKAIKVEWTERTPILTLEQAKTSENAARPEENPEWRAENATPMTATQGDVEKGFAEADTILTWKGQRAWYGDTAAEPMCHIAQWKGETLEVWVKSQWPNSHRCLLAQEFGLKMNQVKINVLFQGGTFGGFHVVSEGGVGAFITTLAAKRVGRPVFWADDRSEDFKFTGEDVSEGDFKVGFKKDGTITAVKYDGVGEAGGVAGRFLPTAFKENMNVKNFSFINSGLKTNLVQPTAIREGSSWMIPTTQVLMKVAAELGMDPTKHALMLDGEKGEGIEVLKEYEHERGFPTDRDSLEECLEAGKKSIDWDNKWHTPGTKKLANGKMHGLGMTWCHEWEDTRGAGTCAIFIHNDGSVQLWAMSNDNGVNRETTYCQIVAEELGCKFEDVFMRGQDENMFSMMTPDGSCNLVNNGYLVRKAAKLAKQRLFERATTDAPSKNYYWKAPFKGMKLEDLEAKDSFVYPKSDPTKKVSFADIARDDQGWGVQPPDLSAFEQAHLAPPIFASMFHRQGPYGGAADIARLCRQAHFCEVEIDTETGEVDVIKVVDVNDVGKVINLGGMQGQQYGGCYMGIGMQLQEEFIHDPMTGVMLNQNLYDYKWATIQTVDQWECIPIETGLGHGPYGTTGIGENVASMGRSLLYGAIYNAIGVWIDSWPITPDKILKALGKI